MVVLYHIKASNKKKKKRPTRGGIGTWGPNHEIQNYHSTRPLGHGPTRGGESRLRDAMKDNYVRLSLLARSLVSNWKFDPKIGIFYQL